MNEVPRSTVITLLVVTVLVSVLGTIAVFMNTPSLATQAQSPQQSTASEPIRLTNSASSSGTVAMRIVPMEDSQ